MRAARVSFLVIALALLGAACGGGDDAAETPTTTAASEVVPDPEELADDPQAAADELAEGLEDLQEQAGGGSATLTVGDQTWTFTSVLCAFGEDQIGQEGAEFNMSSIQDGMQLYASVDSFGDSVSLNDIEDFENPSVDLEAFSADIVVDGKNITASGGFVDGTSDDFTEVPGTLEATCP